MTDLERSKQLLAEAQAIIEEHNRKYHPEYFMTAAEKAADEKDEHDAKMRSM